MPSDGARSFFRRMFRSTSNGKRQVASIELIDYLLSAFCYRIDGGSGLADVSARQCSFGLYVGIPGLGFAGAMGVCGGASALPGVVGARRATERGGRTAASCYFRRRLSGFSCGRGGLFRVVV